MDKAEQQHPTANKDFTKFPPWAVKPIAGSSSSSTQIQVPARGELYCLDHFLNIRIPQWHQSEVSRQMHLCGAAVDKMHRDRGRTAASKNRAKLPAARAQPRRAVRQRRALEELLAEKGRRPNKKLLEGDYVLPKADVAEAVYTTKYHVEGAEHRAGGGFHPATIAFVERLEGAIGEKQKELAKSVVPGRRPGSSCVMDSLEADCPCCRTCSTSIFLPPIQPVAIMRSTPSLGNWPAYMGQPSPMERRLSNMLFTSIVEEIHEGTAMKRIQQDDQVYEKEDVEAAIVTVAGLRFAVDFCDGQKVIML
ncbi:uncharacterized protein PpBr36_10190 [Pyricularia pennisetigena]|uniref:uncharacterized protein n=1 Tax=Pyricularia pennisetigena TaxID=1578925 RepID=UPI001154C5E3|nr:uncharacterized protein PpBr36_10190 [Pyricularia pennisetigena]TLS21547.1 hypothetical protein PpBr36_10190 [Pyricularia pennisetigena]